MALINCPECGKQISDKAQSCPNCGYPVSEIHGYTTDDLSDDLSDIEFEDQQQIYTPTPELRPYEPEQETSVLSIIALILSSLGCTLIIGAIIAVIDLNKHDGKKKGFSIAALVIGMVWSVLIFTIFLSSLSSSKTPSAPIAEKSYVTEEQPTQTVETPDNVENVTPEPEVTYSENVEQSNNDNVITYDDVFFYDLLDNTNYYNGKNIRTTFEVGYCYDDETAPFISSEYPTSDCVENYTTICVYPYNFQEYENGEYITVEGTVAKKDSSDVITNATIISTGTDAKNSFDAGLAVYMQKYNETLQQNKEEFIASCIDVTYEDLRRYPDSYEDVPIKLKITATDVEPDGWIFPGDIIASFSGEELAVYDDRIVREPRIMEGDTITVYAVGYGLSKMKVKQQGVLFNKTVDEYDVPAIKIKYTEDDKDFIEN